MNSLRKTPGHLPPHRRTLNVFVLSMFAVAVIVSLRNLPLTAHYGFSSLFFYLVAALLFMVPYALVSAELASGWPKAGGVYVWVKEAFGERWGFFAIWMQWFHNMTWYPAMLAFLGSGIAYLFFDPALAQNKTFLLSVILIGIWVITLINFFGIKFSSWLSTFCVIIGTIFPGTILILLAVIWLFMGKPLAVDFSIKSFFPDLSHFSNLVFMAGIVLALSGMESIANLAREVRNPQKNYPKAIFIATLITFFLLAFGSIAIAVVIPREKISLVASLLAAFETFFAAFHLKWLVPIMAFFVALGALGELNAWTIAGVKGLFVTSEHGLLPPIFHKTNETQTPTNLLLFQAVIVTLSAFLFLYLPNINLSYWVLSALSAQMYICVYLFLFPAALCLRFKKSKVVRPYRIPYGNVGIWIISVVGFLTALFAFILSFFPPEQIEIGSLLGYELLLLVGFMLIIALPLIIYALRKPHWKLDVLQEIRAEIHRSTH
jgi:putative glutamate/gamma-aminobutyrate antiporter